MGIKFTRKWNLIEPEVAIYAWIVQQWVREHMKKKTDEISPEDNLWTTTRNSSTINIFFSPIKGGFLRVENPQSEWLGKRCNNRKSFHPIILLLI